MNSRRFKQFLVSKLSGMRSASVSTSSSGTFGGLSAGQYIQMVHEERIAKHFQNGLTFEGDAPVFSQKLMILAFTNRSGSNMLADYLLQTKQVGGLGEYLNADTAIRQSKKRQIDRFPDYISSLVNSLSRNRSYFGVKASAEQLRFMDRWRIFQMFPSVTVVHVHRDDLLGQAVSHWIARQTGQWTSLQERQNDEVSFDAGKILQLTQYVARADEAIRMHCAYRGMNYISLSYEEVIADVSAAMSRVGGAADLDFSSSAFQSPRIAKQANDLNAGILQELKRHLASSYTDGSF